jgi:ABC-type multidrug transport system permease subunit
MLRAHSIMHKVRDMVVWFRWLNYLNPVGYAFEARVLPILLFHVSVLIFPPVMVNEFSGRTYPCGAFIPAGPAYLNVSATNKICSTTGAKAGADFVLGTDYVATSFSYTRDHLWRNFGILIAFIVRLFPCALSVR